VGAFIHAQGRSIVIRKVPLTLVALAVAAASAWAQQAASLTIRPTPAPAPALKYLLLPDVGDLKPGNAVVDYYRTFSPETISTWRSDALGRKAEAWCKMPLSELPRKEIKNTARWVLEQLDDGARRDQCEWQMESRVRSEGVGLLLPDLQGFRTLVSFLAARARVEIAEGDFGRAAYTLQTGLAFSRHLNRYPTLITHLIAASTADVMLDQVETFIQTPGAPNLYWALTNLPQPLLELREALFLERMFADSVFPTWRTWNETPLSPQEAYRQSKLVIQHFGMLGFASDWAPQWRDKLLEPLMVCKCYPTAKRYLSAHGHKPADIEAMAALQVVMLFTVERFQVRRDEMMKWLNLPYWQARAGLEQARADVQRAIENLEDGLPVLTVALPAIARIPVRRAQMDRRIAALRVIEAIRLHAASHDGKLPGRLDEITVVPLPIDPMSGKPFEYQRQGDRAELESASISEPGTDRKNSIHYELKLASPN
jgi:hypothetical protein